MRSFTDGSSSRVIYPSSKFAWYIYLLFISKFFRGIGIFFAADVLRTVHVLHFLLLVTLLCSLLFAFVQRPFASGKKITRVIWIKIIRQAILQSIVNVLWLYGLANVGPLRTILLTEHADVVLFLATGAIFKGTGGHGKLRGSFWMCLGVLSLILFDNDSQQIVDHPEGQKHHGISHLLYYLLAWTGLSDHTGGMILLLFTVYFQTCLNKTGHCLAINVGGPKRLNSIVSIVSSLLLIPVALFIWGTQDSSESGFLHSLPHAFVVALFVFSLHYYVEAACIQRLNVVCTARIGTLAIFITSLALSMLWPSQDYQNNGIDSVPTFEHALSGGVIFSFFMFSIATLQLTSGKDKWDESTSETEFGRLLPIHSDSSEPSHKSQSFATFLCTSFSHIIADRNSTTIFYFLCLNLGFTFVEFTYGMLTNSLGLISDGFHMLFDCSALVMGLYASVMARWMPTKTFPFGYGRIEVLSGFVNGLFLTVIGLMVLYEAIWRLVDPPEIHTERLLFVAICGLCVNLLGILAFSHNHAHGHSHNVHSHDSAHIYKGQGHTSHGSKSHAHNNANMQGVYLHILADTLGSVAVIISSLLIDWYGWLIADPICSLVLSFLILASVFPLLKESTAVLLLRVPSILEEEIQAALEKILNMESVLSCQDPHFWHHSGDMYIASVVVECVADVSEQRVIQQVTFILQEAGFTQITVEVVTVSPDKISELPPTQWSLGNIKHSKPLQQLYSIRAI